MVTGGSGLVGKGIEAIVKTEEKRSDEVWIFLSSKDADLTNEASTKAIFEVSTITAIALCRPASMNLSHKGLRLQKLSK